LHWESVMKEETEDMLRERDKSLLEALAAEGFCLGFLPPAGAPAGGAQPDFSVFLPDVRGVLNLVVSAPHLRLQDVLRTLGDLAQRQLADGRTIKAVGGLKCNFQPLVENWFRFQTEIVYIAAAAADPPFNQVGFDVGPWAHCACLRIQCGGTKTRLRVIHVGLGPGHDKVYLHFLIPNALVPKRLLL